MSHHNVISVTIRAQTVFVYNASKEARIECSSRNARIVASSVPRLRGRG